MFIYTIVDDKNTLIDVFSSLELATDFLDACEDSRLHIIRRKVNDEIVATPSKFIEFTYFNRRGGQETFEYEERVGIGHEFGGQPLLFEVSRSEVEKDKLNKDSYKWSIKGRFMFEGNLEENAQLIFFICRKLYKEIEILEKWGWSEEDISHKILEVFNEMIVEGEDNIEEILE